jgi:CxxC motif-containing protein
MKDLICIVCPKGCHIQVDEERDFSVTGNSCPRGAEYGKAELVCPTRTVTSTVRCSGGAHPRCPVKTDRPVPKELIFQVMDEINALSVSAPIRVGQVLLEHVCGTDANIVATRAVTKTES